MKETASESKWREIGNQTILCQDEMAKLLFMIQPYVPKKVLEDLIKAQKNLSNFKSKAEEEMFNRGGPKDNKVFYQK